MAVSKMATWVYETMLRDRSSIYASDGLFLAMKFAVYADLGNASVTPYVRITNCDFFSPTQSVVTSRVAATVKIQINGTGTTYTFNTGSAISQLSFLDYNVNSGGSVLYSTRFSSSTNIPINKTKTEFAFHVTVTTRNGETYTRVLPACGLVPQTLSGPTSTNTGSIYTYTFGKPVNNDNKHLFAVWMSYGEETHHFVDGHTEKWYACTSEAFIEPYHLALDTINNVSSVSFVPLNYSKYQDATGNGGYVGLDYYYIPDGTTTHLSTTSSIKSYTVLETKTAANRYIYATAIDRGICISTIRKSITVNNRTAVDSVLRPDFKSFSRHVYPPSGSNVYQAYDDIYQTMIEKYGGVVQGSRGGYVQATFYADNGYVKYRENRVSGPALKYGSYFKSGVITEAITTPTKTITLEATNSSPTGVVGGLVNGLSYIMANCAISEFTTPGANKRITFSLLDSFGFTTTVTDTLTVLPYHRPGMSVCKAQRCSVASGDEEEIYHYNGIDYTPDESGNYALVEWQIDVSALNNKNSRALKVRMTSSDGWQVLDVNSYTTGGFLVMPVLADISYNIQFSLSDDFYSDQVFIAPLNTVYAMLDFKRGGTGVAMGKVSELDYIYDIHRNWLLHMPYGTYVKNYNADGSAVNLYEWMQRVNRRIEAIINSRDVGVFSNFAVSGSSRWYNGNSTVCIPSGYGSIIEEYALKTNYGSSTDIRTAGWMSQNAITITRPYLNITLGEVFSYSGNTSTSKIQYRPTIYICTTKPTTINQSTGAPNGTIVKQQSYVLAEPDFEGMIDVNGGRQGYYVWNSRYSGGSIQNSYSIDMTSYQGRNVWIVVTATCGYCPGLQWRMTEGRISVSNIWLSNTHV